MFDWSSPRQRKKNAIDYFIACAIAWWVLLYWPSWLGLHDVMVCVAFTFLATGIVSLLAVSYDVPYIRLGDATLGSAKRLAGIHAEQAPANQTKGEKLYSGAYIEVTYVVSPKVPSCWMVLFSEPGRQPLDYFQFYENGTVRWQEASLETPLNESRWQHAGLIRLKWLSIMMQRYGTIPKEVTRRAY
jgi:hypothetical protein